MIRYILICSGILFAVLTAGCSNESSSLGPDDTGLTADDASVVHAGLSGTEISSALLNVCVGFPSGQSVNLHRVLNDWDPSTVSWTSFAGAFSPDIEGSFVAAANGWYEIDVTVMVRSWADGEQGNFGILLEQSSASFAPVMLFSSERPDLTPFLEICYATPAGSPCDTIYPLADVFIDETFPNGTFEGSGTLLIGQMMNPGEEKRIKVTNVGDYAWDYPAATLSDDLDGKLKIVDKNEADECIHTTSVAKESPCYVNVQAENDSSLFKVNGYSKT